MSGAVIHVNYIPPYKNKKSGWTASTSKMTTETANTVSTLGYVDYSGMPKNLTNKKVVKKPKTTRKSAPKTSGQGYLIYLGFNTAPPSRKGGNNTRCISRKRGALYINLTQAPHFFLNQPVLYKP